MHAANESRRPVTGQRSKGPKNGRAPPHGAGVMRQGRAQRDSNSDRIGGWMRARSSGRPSPSRKQKGIPVRAVAVEARVERAKPGAGPSIVPSGDSTRVLQRGAGDGSCASRALRVSSFLQVNKRSECGGAHVHVERSVTATRIYRLPSSIVSSSTIIVVIKKNGERMRWGVQTGKEPLRAEIVLP